MTKCDFCTKSNSKDGCIYGLQSIREKHCIRAINRMTETLTKTQQYRAIGTVKECREAENRLRAKESYIKQILWERNIAIQQLEEISVSLGEKMDSIKEARERQRAKKPNIWGDGYDDEGNMIYDMYDCPNCDKSYEIDYHHYRYCPECGQAIDWSGLGYE